MTQKIAIQYSPIFFKNAQKQNNAPRDQQTSNAKCFLWGDTVVCVYMAKSHLKCEVHGGMIQPLRAHRSQMFNVFLKKKNFLKRVACFAYLKKQSMLGIICLINKFC